MAIMRQFTRRAILSVLACIATVAVPGAPALATTWEHVTKTCPVCGAKVSGRVPRSTFISGMSDDFRPGGVGVDMDIANILTCPKCAFTAGYTRFDKPAGLDKNKVRKALAAVKSTQLFIKLDRAAAVEKAWTANPLLLAKLALAAKWVADDTGEQAIIQRRLSAAIDAHKIALTAKDLPVDQKVICTYLVGELYRQASKTEAAIAWLAKARNMKGQGYAALLASKQLFRARHEGKRIATVLAAARKGSDTDRLAAVALLRDSKDKAAIAFLKDFVLNCPKRLREDAIQELLIPQARKHHLPIFLQGLKNRHYRTVQGSAYGVESLQAAQAAPIILEALKNPPEFADYRLLDALAVTATEKELPALAKLMARRENRPEVFRALLNTRSKKAVPLIVKWLSSDAGSMPTEKEQWVADAVAIGPDLLKALPKLATANEDSPAAMFKIRVLGAIRTDMARKRLRTVLKRNDDLSLEAALGLVAQGDASGKAILLKNIERIRGRDSVSITRLYPMLVPADFEGLHQGMKKELVESEVHHNRLTAELEEQSKSEDESQREEAQYELKQRRPFDPDWIAYQWMPLLGATGNPKARPILMKYLDHPKSQYRAGAIEALASVYDKTVGDAFVRRLATEDEWVRVEIIRAIGTVGDRSRLKALRAVVKGPTLIGTKLAWMDTMLALHPNDARATLKEWAASPDATLAARAKEALAKTRATAK